MSEVGTKEGANFWISKAQRGDENAWSVLTDYALKWALRAASSFSLASMDVEAIALDIIFNSVNKWDEERSGKQSFWSYFDQNLKGRLIDHTKRSAWHRRRKSSEEIVEKSETRGTPLPSALVGHLEESEVGSLVVQYSYPEHLLRQFARARLSAGHLERPIYKAVLIELESGEMGNLFTMGYAHSLLIDLQITCDRFIKLRGELTTSKLATALGVTNQFVGELGLFYATGGLIVTTADELCSTDSEPKRYVG